MRIHRRDAELTELGVFLIKKFLLRVLRGGPGFQQLERLEHLERLEPNAITGVRVVSL
jgi:hypothetical protein